MSKSSERYQVKKELIDQINEARQLKKNKWKKVKELQLKMLEIDPDNLSALYELMNIAKRKSNLQELKKMEFKNIRTKTGKYCVLV